MFVVPVVGSMQQAPCCYCCQQARPCTPNKVLLPLAVVQQVVAVLVPVQPPVVGSVSIAVPAVLMDITAPSSSGKFPLGILAARKLLLVGAQPAFDSGCLHCHEGIT